MEKLRSGNFFGITDQKIESDNFIFTNTAYTHNYVDWHSHDNAYFTFLLAGKMIEGDSKGERLYGSGSLIFHNLEDSHYNIKPDGYTRGIHIELLPKFMPNNALGLNNLEGNFEIIDPEVKIIFYNIYKNAQFDDDTTLLEIENLVCDALEKISCTSNATSMAVPSWVRGASEFLEDNYKTPYTLKKMADALGIHPVHLSRSFTKYYGCTLAAYIRKIRVERAFSELLAGKKSLSYIAHDCGFADQSHMVRCFKEFTALSPTQFKNLLKP